MARRLHLFRALAAAACTAASALASAQITLDGTMGPAGALPGPNYQIPAARGTQVGGNLFHSFGLFSVGTGQSATFSGPGSVSNIIGRVTGGAVSAIDGAIRSNIAGANLFLVNPAGILFGPNASLDVSGSFYASSAHYVALGASGRYDTLNANATVLSSAPPSAFGFLGPPNGIVVDRSVLNGAPGRGVTLVGGPLLISGAQLSAPAGSLNLGSVASAGEVSLSPSAGGFPPGLSGGVIEIISSLVDASSTANLPGGAVVIRGGTLTLRDASVGLNNFGAEAALGVLIDAQAALSLERSSLGAVAFNAGSAGPVSIVSPSITMNASAVVSHTRGRAAAGPLGVQTSRLALTGGAFIESSATGAGPGGSVSIAALESVSVSGFGANGFPSNITSVSFDAGLGGNVLVTAPLVSLDGGALFTNVFGTGAAGTIAVLANRVTLTNGARIDSSSFGPAAAGSINVTATESLIVTGGGPFVTVTGIGSAAFGRGAGGDILLSAPRIDLTRAQVKSSSEGAGAAGNIAIFANDFTTSFALVDASASGAGAAGNIQVQAARVVVKDGSQVNSSALGGASGRVSVTAFESVIIARGAAGPAVETGLVSTTSGEGAGGAIVVTAPTLSLDDGLIRTRSLGAGRAGDIALNASRLMLTKGAQIDSSAFGAGAAGNLTAAATESVTIAGRNDSGRISGLFSAAVATGAGGNIVIQSPAIEVSGGLVSADALASGAPGNVTIETGTLALVAGGVVSSSSLAPGPGSRVNITATESFTISGEDAGGNRSAILGTNRGDGGGTDIAIVTPLMTIDGGGITAASSGAGPSGGITIAADRVALLRGGQISSSSEGAGNAGSVNMAATESITLSGSRAGQPSGVFVRTFAGGDGGAVVLSAPLIVLEGGAVNVGTEGTGSAGNITITAGRLELAQGALLDSSTSAAGRGGKIDIAASESVTVTGSANQATAVSSTAKALGSAGEVTIAAPLIKLDGGIVSGDTSGAGAGGNITIAAATLELSNAGQVVSTASGRGAGGRVSITASDAATITGPSTPAGGSGVFVVTLGAGDSGDIMLTSPVVALNGGAIAASTFGAGKAGNVSIHGDRVTVTAGGFIDSSSLFAGDAGRVLIDAAQAIAISGASAEGNASRVSSTALGSGRGGEVFMRAPSITADGGKVRADALGTGIGGRILVDTGRLALTNGGQLSSSAADDAIGGTVSVTASEALLITDSAANLTSAGIFAATLGGGRGGEITVTAPLVSINGGAISSTTFGGGAAGRIFIQAPKVTLAGGGLIDSSSLGGTGAAGIINVTASDSIEITGRAASGLASSISSRTEGQGRGGDLVLSAPTFLVDNALVRVDTSGRGSAGRIAIDAARATISGGGVVASGTGAQGNGGTLNVIATESITVTGRNSEGRSRISNSSAGAGQAGEIFLSAPRISIEDSGFVNGSATQSGAAGSIDIRGGTLTLTSGEISTDTARAGAGGAINVLVTESVALNGSSISASSSGSGDAGSIFIDAGRSLTLVGSSITTAASSADGGNIGINAIDLLRLTDSRITTSVGRGFGNGGNITIDPVFVILDGSQIIANAFGGNGGNIFIVTNALLQSGDSVISASSQLGIQGTIEISAPESDLTGGLAALPSALFDPSLLLRESCSARAARGGNSFVGVGYGGLPDRPGSLAFSSYADRPVSSAAGGERLPLFALVQAFQSACF